MVPLDNQVSENSPLEKNNGEKMEALDKMFGVTEAGSDVNTEVNRCGDVPTMAYILLVNPSMLSMTGIPFNDALFVTPWRRSLVMVWRSWARLPFALAPDGPERLLRWSRVWRWQCWRSHPLRSWCRE